MKQRTETMIFLGWALFAILTLTACSSGGQRGPGDRPYVARWCPAGSPCSLAIQSGMLPTGPGASVEAEAWNQAVAEVTARVGTLKRQIRPKIVYMSCDFNVGNATVSPGGPSVRNVCAAGKTTENGKEIWVSVEKPDRVKALLVWEMSNSLLIRNGHGRLAY